MLAVKKIENLISDHITVAFPLQQKYQYKSGEIHAKFTPFPSKNFSGLRRRIACDPPNDLVMCRFIFIDEGEAMNWFTNTMGSSIGKKLLMAVTGLCFCGFLAMHLAGNLTIYGGGEAFNAYAEKLHSLGALLTVSEFGLLFFALVHVGMGLLLFFENRKARPVSYAVKKMRVVKLLALPPCLTPEF